jgi:cell division protein FtsW
MNNLKPQIAAHSGKKTMKMDYTLLGTMLILLIGGLIMLASASQIVSINLSGKSTYYLMHQILYGAIPGLLLMYIASKINYKVWQKYAPLLMFVTIGLLVAVLLPHVGIKVGNSRRWINAGPLSIQPSEIVKLVLIFYVASWIDKRQNNLKDFWYGLIPSLIIVLIVAALIIIEPDIGTMLVVIATALTMLFVGGIELKHLWWIFLAGLVAFGILVKMEPYRLQRFVAYLNPTADPKGIGYQINQALLAIGSGGWFGYGYGQSRQKRNYLPEVMGDSIFAVIVEELGFVRALIFPLLYGFFAFRGLKIANATQDVFGKMVAVGIVSWICFQAMINIGAIIGILPLTGIPLPLVSYGSSALIINLAAFGVLLNISKQAAV